MNENLKTDSPDNGAGYCVQSFRLNLETKLLWGHQTVEAGRQDKFYLALQYDKDVVRSLTWPFYFHCCTKSRMDHPFRGQGNPLRLPVDAMEMMNFRYRHRIRRS